MSEQEERQAPEPEKKPRKKGKGCLIAVGVVVLLFILIGIIGSGGSEEEATAPPPEPEPEPIEQSEPVAPEPAEPTVPTLELIDHSDMVDGMTRYVVGTVKNNSSETFGYVQVEINLYDDSGAQVGSTIDNTNNLAPGGTWKFKALIFEDEATSYKIVDVTGF